MIGIVKHLEYVKARLNAYHKQLGVVALEERAQMLGE